MKKKSATSWPIVHATFFLLFAPHLQAQEKVPDTNISQTATHKMDEQEISHTQKAMQNEEPGPPAPQTGTQQKNDNRKLNQILKKLDKEPTVDQLIVAGLRFADAGGNRSQKWQKSVRRAAILPRVKVSVGYDLERDESLDRYQNDPDRWGADTDKDLGVQLTAQWELPELVYNPDELKVYNTLSDRAERRETIISMIIGYYFERRRLQILNAIRPSMAIEERVEHSIRLKELTAIIDALTGGALARNL